MITGTELTEQRSLLSDLELFLEVPFFPFFQPNVLSYLNKTKHIKSHPRIRSEGKGDTKEEGMDTARTSLFGGSIDLACIHMCVIPFTFPKSSWKCQETYLHALDICVQVFAYAHN